jgi:cytochrome c-type biogenesis protein CcsB
MTLESGLLQACFALLCAATLLSWGQLIFDATNRVGVLMQTALVLANVGITVLLLIRWACSGHIPLSNLYESSLCLAWSVTCLSLILQGRWHIPPRKGHQMVANAILGLSENSSSRTNEREWLTAILSPGALFSYGFATLSLPKEMQHSSALVPALQSNWLMMHVSMMILSYGALLCGSLLAVTLLVIEAKTHRLSNQTPFASAIPPLQTETSGLAMNERKLEASGLEWECFCLRQTHLASQLDHWSYRTIGMGFPLLTAGILSGAVWANESWGSYWSWDPKEVWALITWLIFAVYLHARLSQGWYGTRSAWIASLGLLVIWVCYLGVNLLGKGLHSYGWLQ